MKIEITYEFDRHIEPYYFARGVANGKEMLRCGNTWKQARARLIEYFAAIQNQEDPPTPPPPETVTI